MTRFTARIIGPEQLTAAELQKALAVIGCHLEAQPMAGNRPAFQNKGRAWPPIRPFPTRRTGAEVA